MPNFAIPGKPEYSGENMTKTASKGPWHIPNPSDKRGPADVVVQVAAVNASANASNKSSPAKAAPAALAIATPV